MNSTEFLASLVDSIAPGGAVAAGFALPAASAVGCHGALAEALTGNAALRSLVDRIVAHAGGEEAFSAADAQRRSEWLDALQREQQEHFAGLVTLVLAQYYAQSEVLQALNWPARPPQPKGHELPPFDESLLAPVRARGPIWRRC